jgi:hypothetical protein
MKDAQNWRGCLALEETEGRGDCTCRAMHDMTWGSGVNDMNSEVAKSNRSHGSAYARAIATKSS